MMQLTINEQERKVVFLFFGKTKIIIIIKITRSAFRKIVKKVVHFGKNPYIYLTTNHINKMNNFLTKYEKILEILKQFETKSNFLNQIRRPRLSDIELIALDITAESLSIDSEYQLFRTLPSSLSSKIERSVYNRRRRRLFFVKERIRKALSEKLTGSENYFIVDSMPLEICKLSRSSRTTICKDDFLTSPSKG